MTTAVKVAAFGSCRIFTPLARAQSQGLVQTTHKGIEWYTHSTQEAIQKADIVECRREVPEEILPLLIDTADKYHADAHDRDKFVDTDIIVLELSTLKRIQYDGWQLQQWRVARLMDGSATDAPEESIRIARASERTELSADEFLSLLEDFRIRMGKPLLIVPHLTCASFSEPVLRPRLKIRRLVEKFRECHDDVAMYDPTPTVVSHGVQIALIDSGHYEPAFNKVIGTEMGEACRQLQMQCV